MNWVALFTAIVALLEKVIPIIKDLFDKAEKTGGMPDLAPEAVNEAFDRAKAQTYWFQLLTRRAIERARGVALKRAHELVAVAKGNAPAAMLKLSEAEHAALKG